ncbi:MAG: nucleotidyltransferase family protein [Flavipsychrobacter sp.]|nr:nucleotidyltransferase family protein [Flavipsychrobacter sp.]
MLRREDILATLGSHKSALVEKYNVKTLGLFGSYSRNDASDNSDVDLLVDFSEPIGIEFVDLADELEDLLRHKVDLVSVKAVKQKYLELIQKDIIYV